jgi:hypothetical protein
MTPANLFIQKKFFLAFSNKRGAEKNESESKSVTNKRMDGQQYAGT